jgi:Na+/proline symporter
MEILGLHWLDFTTLSIYLLAIILIGVYTQKKIKTSGDFFMGGRRFGKWAMTMFGFGSGTHADQAVAVISKTYQVGLAGIWYQWLWLFCTPFYWILAPLFRRMRCITTADYFEKRYSTSVATLYTVSALAILVADMGTMLLGSGKVIEALTLGRVNYTAAVFAVTVMFLIYGLAGGLIAAVVTDFIQGIFTIVLSFILVPFALYKVGGFSGLHQKLDDNLFSLIAPGEITFFFITMVVINGLFNIVVQPHIMSNTSAGKSEFEGRFGFTAGNFLKRFCTVAWALVGLACIALYPDLKDSDHAFGTAARDLLPIGLAGILMASLIASVQSTCDALMVTAAGLYTRNIHRRFIRPQASEREQVFVGRIASLAVVCGGLIFAFVLTSVVHALELFWKVSALMGIAFWFGILWRRANVASAWMSFGGAALMFVLCEVKVFDVNLPMEMLMYLVTGIVLGLVGGFVFPRQQKKKLDDFYLTLHTPVGQEKKLRDAGVDIILE